MSSVRTCYKFFSIYFSEPFKKSRLHKNTVGTKREQAVKKLHPYLLCIFYTIDLDPKLLEFNFSEQRLTTSSRRINVPEVSYNTPQQEN